MLMDSQSILGSRIAQSCRSRQPKQSSSLIFLDSMAMGVKHSKAELSWSMVLLRRLSIPAGRLTIVRRRPPVALEFHSSPVIGFGLICHRGGFTRRPLLRTWFEETPWKTEGHLHNLHDTARFCEIFSLPSRERPTPTEQPDVHSPTPIQHGHLRSAPSRKKEQ